MPVVCLVQDTAEEGPRRDREQYKEKKGITKVGRDARSVHQATKKEVEKGECEFVLAQHGSRSRQIR